MKTEPRSANGPASSVRHCSSGRAGLHLDVSFPIAYPPAPPVIFVNLPASGCPTTPFDYPLLLLYDLVNRLRISIRDHAASRRAVPFFSRDPPRLSRARVRPPWTRSNGTELPVIRETQPSLPRISRSFLVNGFSWRMEESTVESL